jgi:uncharacterized protein YndB with AHSA1/START domain
MKASGILTAVLVAITFTVGLVGALMPMRHEVSRSATFRQPAEKIWQAVTDFSDFPSWRGDVKKIEKIPSQTGSWGWKEISRYGASTVRVLQEEKPKRFIAGVSETDLPFASTWTYEITTGTAGETVVTITERGEIYNPFIRFASRIFSGNHGEIDRFLIQLGKKFGEEVRPS